MMSDSVRPTLNRRPNYEPTGPQEQFIVPLLRRHIEHAISIYANAGQSARHALDVGCGRQPFRGALESRGYSYTGLDVEQNPEGAVDVVCGIDETLPAELTCRGPFDFILCTEVLEHVADWDTAFKNLAHLLAPGGRLLITTPHFFHLHEEPYDFWRPTPHATSYFAQRVGLRVVEQETAGDAWDVLGTLLANCRVASVRSRLRNRFAGLMVAVCRRILFSLVSDQRIRRTVRLDSALYLSNVAVLERP